ncbi:DUF4178 domain-containing protein [Rapidithrix thailandica]|uniref:DUF4178 domain-containing protein n=1 Tax=Rapidithrix thailandica TaxID=413964 RepID=A0AAW9S143_9BACT
MPFGFFKKKKEKKEEGPHYDPTNIRLTDLRKGFVVDYNLKTWEVAEEYEYDWGDNYFSYEFKLVSSDETIFLSLDEDDELEIQVLKKINFGRLDEGVEESLINKGKPPRKIEYEGKTYYRESERPGYFRNTDNENWSEFITWDYYDDSEKYALNIEQWGEDEFEASVGVLEEPEQFSNILPG